MVTEKGDIDSDQSKVFTFLRDASSWSEKPTAIKVIETVGAMVFLSPCHALKVKRAIRTPYFDFTTLEARERVCRREMELNQPHAPDIYLKLIAITRDDAGQLSLDGTGHTIEWAVLMRRFEEDDVLSAAGARHHLTDSLAGPLGDMVWRLHDSAAADRNSTDRLPGVIDAVSTALTGMAPVSLLPAALQVAGSLREATALTQALRLARASDGFVRRCHGDLHLGNIVMWHGRPVPFDALEFDEGLATIDVLYDLAFLLMDLCRHDRVALANRVLNRYVWRSRTASDLTGLAALPLYIALRAAVRAMVALDRCRIGLQTTAALHEHVAATLDFARQSLDRKPARLVAIGGLSGSGKSTLAAALAPSLGPVPGALHLRSDMERKAMMGVLPEQRLPPKAYSSEAGAKVQAVILERAGIALAAGHSVIVDAVLAKSGEREALQALAGRLSVGFQGLWLSAPLAVLQDRVAARLNDVSDATVEVVAKQQTYDTGSIDWPSIEARGAAADVEKRARHLLHLT